MKIRLIVLCSLALLFAISAHADVEMSGDGADLAVVEENLPAKGETTVNQQETTLFKDADWHKNKWQNMPAIIEITDTYINLLFNRPEILFGLRRGIRFDWQDTHEYSDGRVVTTYRFSRTPEGRAQIDYSSVLVADPAQTASGSFEIEARP
ncbi:MAG: hypothetical protein CVV42_12755 [Candidatus Riflebacteria bacterium HGW-Riflebacteria-2]|jgi:hypothetical protein|nr:MAG: hypothetical protein CVV42_12755 [Candidatus Riflebacteria bacterium HGW-Riflebacteria-2]